MKTKTRKLIADMSMDELQEALYLCGPDKLCMARKKYGFIPDKSTIEIAIADMILLEL